MKQLLIILLVLGSFSVGAQTKVVVKGGGSTGGGIDSIGVVSNQLGDWSGGTFTARRQIAVYNFISPVAGQFLSLNEALEVVNVAAPTSGGGITGADSAYMAVDGLHVIHNGFNKRFVPVDSVATSTPPPSSVFLANFTGTNGTALSSYTPENGTVYEITGTSTLNGAGLLSMPATSGFKITTPSANYTATAIFGEITDGSIAYFVLRESADGNTHTRVQIQRTGNDYTLTIVDYVATVATVLYTSNNYDFAATDKVLTVTLNGSALTVVQGAVNQSLTTGTSAAGNARLTVVGVSATVDKIEIN